MSCNNDVNRDNHIRATRGCYNPPNAGSSNALGIARHTPSVSGPRASHTARRAPPCRPKATGAMQAAAGRFASHMPCKRGGGVQGGDGEDGDGAATQRLVRDDETLCTRVGGVQGEEGAGGEDQTAEERADGEDGVQPLDVLAGEEEAHV